MKTKNNTEEVGGNHYQQNGDIEPVHIMARFKLNWFQGEVLKYISRHWNKNGKTDLLKAEHICDMADDLFGFDSNYKGTSILAADEFNYIEEYCKQYIKYYEDTKEPIKNWLIFKKTVTDIVLGYYSSVKAYVDQQINMFYGTEK